MSGQSSPAKRNTSVRPHSRRIIVVGGALGADGSIYAIPGHAKQVLKIDGDEVTLVGPKFEGKYKWLSPLTH